jgi:ferric-dicitrate binding protein FerR (iron transport regulator)
MNEPVPHNPGSAGHDPIGELIRDAGKRAVPNAGEHRRVLEASRAAWQSKVRNRRRRRLTYFGAALAAAAAAVGGVAALFPAGPVTPVATVATVRGEVEHFAAATRRWDALAADTPLVPGERIRTVADGVAAFDLPMGGSIRVASGTTFTFAPAGQIQLEAGTLYFDSGSRGERVEVVTPFGTVHEFGTQFEVQALSGGLRVRVREGSVEVAARGQRLSGQPGEQVSISAAGEVLHQTVATHDATWSWAESLASPLRVAGVSAYDVLRWATRESGQRLVFEDASAEARARNAVLAGGQGVSLSPAEALTITAATTSGLAIAAENGVVTVRSR